MTSKTLYEDTEQILADANIPWEDLRDGTVLITGATGTIGAMLVRALCATDRKYGLGIRMLACGRNRSRAKPLTEYGAEFIAHDICEPLRLTEPIDYIIHCAAMAKSPDMAARPVEVAETSLKGTINILALAREKQVRGMVYLSSLEVYGDTDPSLPFVTESDLGRIDIGSTRSCYPEAKRMCENLCACYAAQYGVPVKTARLAQTFGASSSRLDTLAVTQFANNALAGNNIILHTEGRSRGNYCYLADAVRGLFFLLLRGENGETYNIVNPDASMTIREMAELLANEVCDGKVSVVTDVPVDIEKRGYAPDVTRRLSAEKVMRLGWRPRYGLADMYRRMMADWQENEEPEQADGGKL
jgi:nucleoside-diphosphate-sugar epimerase